MVAPLAGHIHTAHSLQQCASLSVAPRDTTGANAHEEWLENARAMSLALEQQKHTSFRKPMNLSALFITPCIRTATALGVKVPVKVPHLNALDDNISLQQIVLLLLPLLVLLPLGLFRLFRLLLVMSATAIARASMVVLKANAILNA